MKNKKQITGTALKKEHVPVCNVYRQHEDNILPVQEQIAAIAGMEDLFKALADQTRLKIIYALLFKDELCVCDIAGIANVTVALASHHLRLLYQMRLAKYQKRGKYVYYSLDDEHVNIILAQALEHWRHLHKGEK